MPPEQTEEAAWSFDFDMNAQQFLNAIWPHLLRDTVKLQQLARTTAFVRALVANPEFAQQVALLGEAAALKAVATAMR